MNENLGSNSYSGYNWWTSSVASIYNAVNVNNNGCSHNNNATNANGVRPAISCNDTLSILRSTESGVASLKGSYCLFPGLEDYNSGNKSSNAHGSIRTSPLYGIANANALYDAFLKAKKGSDWKSSVQRYEASFLRNIYKTQKELLSGKYKQSDFAQFLLSERGKTRLIKSVTFKDRVVQRSLCDNYLAPRILPKLIYDNGASVKGKGFTFAQQRLHRHLQQYIRKYGTEGYILQIDFTKFFDNLRHDKIYEILTDSNVSDEVKNLLYQVIDPFKVDVSYMSDEEYADCLNKLFNSLDYMNIPKEQQTGEKFMRKSVGIGSQVSQLIGIHYPTPIDTYCKVVRSCKYYGRYMDDIYVIHKDKDFLKSVLAGIKEIADKLGIFLHERKTHITKLSRGFTYLKIRYKITSTGKIIRRQNPKVFVRERRRLKKLRQYLDEGKITYKQASDQYRSWRNTQLWLNSYKSVKAMDELFNSLFEVNNYGEERNSAGNG